MFINKQNKINQDQYLNMLQAVGSLSRLFSESKAPYLYYRVAENIFCKSFGAKNLSRSDISVDASFNSMGIGLKTFLKAGQRKMEKIAEFNNDSAQFRGLSAEKQISEISRLRNERIAVTKKIYSLDDMIYHCVIRSEGKMVVIETPMQFVDIDSIKIKNSTDKSLAFQDKFNEYIFNISKSTLFKAFISDEALLEFPVKIIEDPFLALERFFASSAEEIKKLVFEPIDKAKDHVFLPLYSTRGDRYNKEVPEKSGLNQWNAGGRERSLGEVYIPIPAWIHANFPGFFPSREAQFSLALPDNRILTAKVCQENSKALMTNPNEALGEWILRDVLEMKEGELLTYKKLEDIGLDSVVVYKNADGNYKIDFAKIDSYDDFEEEYNA